LKKEILSGNLNRALHLSGTILKTIRDKSLNYEYIASAFSDHCELLILEKHSRLQGVRNIEKSDPLLTKELFRYCLKSFLYGKIYPAHLGAAYRSFAWYFAFTRRRRLAKYFFKKAIHRHHSLDMRYEEAKSLRDYALFLDERHLPGEARDYYNRAFQKFENAGAVLESERLQDKVDPDLVKAPFNQAPSIYDTYDSGISFSSDIDYMRVNTLFEVSSLMSRMDDMNALLPQILLALIKATGAQHGGLFLDEDNPYSEQTFLMNFDGKPLSPEQMVISEDILEWVKANQKIMLVKDGVKDPRIRASAEKHRIRSVLCVPLLREDEYIGCAYLSNDRISNLFTQGAEKAAYILSTQAGILLENAYLMDSYKKLNTRLERQVKEQTNDIRKKNKQLEAFNVRLIESERMKSLLTGTLVHDIKNHASGIFQNIKVLARKFKEQPRVQKNLGMMADSCNDIVGLSSNLLDIGKMEEGKLEVTRRSVTYAEIRKIIDKFTHGVIFEEKGIRVNVIPPAGKFEIEADLYLLQRVLQNLFSNASKYTEQRGEVIISFETGDRENIISIFNSGPPIPEGMKESLFDKYSRLGDKRSVFSKGLGLYFCRMVMHAHGGKIWVDTDAHGNSFKISFINRPKADIKQNDSDIPKIVSHDLSKEEETP
jgi:signal transduction histidine kinase